MDHADVPSITRKTPGMEELMVEYAAYKRRGMQDPVPYPEGSLEGEEKEGGKEEEEQKEAE